MLALFSTAFILFGAPAILLFAGRLIQTRTDALHRVATLPEPVTQGTEWYYRAPAPLLGTSTNPVANAPIYAPDEDGRWFHRPLPPLFAWPDVRQLFRRPRAAQSGQLHP